MWQHQKFNFVIHNISTTKEKKTKINFWSQTNHFLYLAWNGIAVRTFKTKKRWEHREIAAYLICSKMYNVLTCCIDGCTFRCLHHAEDNSSQRTVMGCLTLQWRCLRLWNTSLCRSRAGQLTRRNSFAQHPECVHHSLTFDAYLTAFLLITKPSNDS